MVLPVVAPRLRRICGSEAVRDGRHEVVLVRVDLVVVVEDIGVAGSP